jgi:hypothetical protein
MRAVFHPRIFSDLAKVMEYYERVATRELADDFTGSSGCSWRRQSRGRSRFQFASATFAARICGGFRIISSFAWSENACGFSWCGITAAVRLSA